jgi:RNA polymerase sigma-70 factor (ECF subfamily)
MTGVLSSIEASIPALRRYAGALLRSRQDSDDLVHDCLVRAMDRLHTLQREDDLRPWLFSIMHNLFVSQRRRARRSPEHDGAGALHNSNGMPAAQEDRLRWRDLERCLDNLPEEQRIVLLLVSLEDLTFSEVAQTLGVPIGTVMSRLARGRERLRVMMDETERPNLRRVK